VRAQIINIASFLNKITTFVSPKVVPLYICSCGKVLKLKFWFEKGIALESVQEPKEILMLFLIGAFLQLQQNIFVRNFFHLSSLKKKFYNIPKANLDSASVQMYKKCCFR
jgi:hypothetical protein